MFQPNAQQRKFLEIGNWVLNTNHARGSGRTTAMAYSAIMLAMTGKTIYLYDPSVVLAHGTQHQIHRYFSGAVQRIAKDYFPDHDFEFRMLDNTMRYLGPKPSVSPVVLDDDGSDENQ